MQEEKEEETRLLGGTEEYNRRVPGRARGGNQEIERALKCQRVPGGGVRSQRELNNTEGWRVASTTLKRCWQCEAVNGVGKERPRSRKK